MADLDAIVVGAGPNGLTAAITLAQAGLRVRVYEAAERIGGGARTEELTLPGFLHDPCSAVHPLGAGSPVFRSLPLEQQGLEWIVPDLALAHPFPDGRVAALDRSPERTASSLGPDRDTYLRLVEPYRDRWDELAGDLLRPVLGGLPRHPLVTGRFGLPSTLPASVLARRFRSEQAKGMLAGLAAHVMAPLTAPATAGVAMMFALAAHDNGWPFPRGGSQGVSDALAALLRSLGGEIETNHWVGSLDELPSAQAYLLDTSPTGLAAVAGSRLPSKYVDRLRRYSYGPGVYKLDYALSEPVPWAAEECRRAGTVHLGPSLPEIGAALSASTRGAPPNPPFLIAAQPTVYDKTRAPDGSHVFWVYAHVPNGYRGDFTAAVENQVERFAPGFRDTVLARHVTTPADQEARNANNVGGDIAVGRCDKLGLLFRPAPFPVVDPYATPNRSVYLCSSATPPGPGVHGMCGYHAARSALRRVFGTRIPAVPRGRVT